MFIEENYHVLPDILHSTDLESMLNWFENNTEGRASMTYDSAYPTVFSSMNYSSQLFKPSSGYIKLKLKFNNKIEKNFFRLCFGNKLDSFLISQSLEF